MLKVGWFSFLNSRSETTSDEEEDDINIFYVHLGSADSEADLLKLFQDKSPRHVFRLLCVQYSKLEKEARKRCPVRGEVVSREKEDILVVCKFLRKRYVAIAVIVWDFLFDIDADNYYQDLSFLLSSYGISRERAARKGKKECGCQGPRHLIEE
jgi:predicted transcriptional regulator